MVMRCDTVEVGALVTMEPSSVAMGILLVGRWFESGS